MKFQYGFSVIEVLLALALLSGCLLLSTQSFWQVEHSLKDQDLAAKRVHLFHSLINIIGMPGSIRSAAEKQGTSSALWKCIRGPTCTITGGPFGVALRLPPMSAAGTSIILSGPVSGPPGSPIFYSLTGESCDPTVTTCQPDKYFIAVTTQYEIFCPPRYDLAAQSVIWTGPIYPNGLGMIMGPTCGRAHYFRIFYKFEAAPATPDGFRFRTVTGFVMVNAVDVAFNR